MPLFPPFSRGNFGKLSWSDFNEASKMFAKLAKKVHKLDSELRRRKMLPLKPFLAKITSSASLATNRWKYAWSEVVLDRTDDGFDIPASGRTGTTTVDYAINTVEATNDGTGVQAPGIDIDGAAYPAGFAMIAISGNPVVVMYPIPDDEGRLRFFFSAENAHDGTC